MDTETKWILGGMAVLGLGYLLWPKKEAPAQTLAPATLPTNSLLNAEIDPRRMIMPSLAFEIARQRALSEAALNYYRPPPPPPPPTPAPVGFHPVSLDANGLAILRGDTTYAYSIPAPSDPADIQQELDNWTSRGFFIEDSSALDTRIPYGDAWPLNDRGPGRLRIVFSGLASGHVVGFSLPTGAKLYELS